MENPVLIFGAGKLGAVALDTFTSNHVVTYGFLDDDKKNHGLEINEITVLGSTDDDKFLNLIGKKCEAFIALENTSDRKSLVSFLKKNSKKTPVNCIHSNAHLSETTEIGNGNFVQGASSLNTNVTLGDHNIIGSNVTIDHHSTIGSFVQIGAGCTIGNGVSIDDEAFIGSGAIVLNGIKIGKGASIGTGSVVIKDVQEDETVFGNPAQVVKM